jgi:hypothetical protein
MATDASSVRRKKVIFYLPLEHTNYIAIRPVMAKNPKEWYGRHGADDDHPDLMVGRMVHLTLLMTLAATAISVSWLGQHGDDRRWCDTQKQTANRTANRCMALSIWQQTHQSAPRSAVMMRLLLSTAHPLHRVVRAGGGRASSPRISRPAARPAGRNALVPPGSSAHCRPQADDLRAPCANRPGRALNAHQLGYMSPDPKSRCSGAPSRSSLRASNVKKESRSSAKRLFRPRI